MAGRDRFDPLELEELKSRQVLSSIFARFGYKVRGKGRLAKALCPFHAEKTGSCKVDDATGRFKCFGCGARGDVIEALMHFTGRSFVEAVEELGGVREQTPQDREKFDQQRREVEERETAERARNLSSCERIFDKAKPIAGTLAAAYLEARGLEVLPSWTFDLRFVPLLDYRGYANDNAEETEPLGKFPAMVAAIRDVQGSMIGLHRTYLDPVMPRKLSPPGDARRNATKKVMGEQSGGLIWLSEPSPRLAMGEGIETSRAWYVLGHGGDDVSLAATVSLGNLSGGCEGTIPHPTMESRRIPNGEPDLDRPGVILRPDIEEVILIGDGDSEPVTTKMRLLVGGRRYRHDGRDVFVHMAPRPYDFNDVLMKTGGAQ